MDNSHVIEESLKERRDIESDRLGKQMSLAEVAKSKEAEKDIDSAEVENRAYMKEQQRLARRYQSKFRKS